MLTKVAAHWHGIFHKFVFSVELYTAPSKLLNFYSQQMAKRQKYRSKVSPDRLSNQWRHWLPLTMTKYQGRCYIMRGDPSWPKFMFTKNEKKYWSTHCHPRRITFKMLLNSTAKCTVTYGNIIKLWGATIAQWIRLHLPFCCHGFESQARHLHFYKFIFIFVMWKRRK